MTIHKALYPRDDVNRLYVSIKEGGRRLASVEDSLNTSIKRLKDYILKNKERLITATRNNTNNSRINRTTITWKQQLEEKQLYGYFKRQTSEISHEKIWTWPRKGNLKRETEFLLKASQDNAIRINYIKTKIDKTLQNNNCRLCGDRGETSARSVMFIVVGSGHADTSSNPGRGWLHFT